MRDRTMSVRLPGAALVAMLLLGACGLAIALWSSSGAPQADELSRGASEAPVAAPTALSVVARQAQESSATSPAVESSPTKPEPKPKARFGEPAATRARSATICGVVREGAGEVVRATVKASALASELSAACDAEGRYELVVPSRLKVVATVREPGFVPERIELESIESGQRVTVDFVLTRAYQVQGRVMDEHDSPIAGARVRVFGADECVSDGEGRYRLDHLDPRHSASTIAVDHAHIGAAYVEVRPRGMDVIQRDLVLKRGGAVRGVVLEESGAPIAKAAVRLGSLRTVSAADGTFELSSVGEGHHALEVRKKGFAPHFADFTLNPGRDAEPLRISLRRAHFLGGIVRDEAGAPLARILVSAAAADAPPSSSTLTKKDGRFRLEGLPPDGVVLRFSGAGYQELREASVAVDHETLEIVLRRSGRLAGRVVDAATGLGLQDFTVHLDRADLQPGEKGVAIDFEWSRGRRFLGKDGAWDSGATALETGALCDLVIRAPGKPAKRIHRVIVTATARPEDCIVALESGGVVRGRVLYSDGLPAGGIVVHIEAEREGSNWLLDLPDRQITLEDGSFRIEGVPPGAIKLRVSEADGRTLLDGPFPVERGVEVERTLVLDRGQPLTGVLRDGSGRPVAEAVVEARSRERGGPSFDAVQRTNARGEFRFEKVPLGRLELQHVAREGELRVVPCGVEIVVHAGENVVDLRPPQGSCSIRGTVRAEVPLPEILVLSVQLPRSEEGQTTFRQLDVLVRNGSFEIDGLEPGTYALLASTTISGARWSVMQRVLLTEGGAREVELVLRAMRYRSR